MSLTTHIHHRPPVLSMLNLTIAVGAASVAVVAITTDDVAERQIKVPTVIEPGVPRSPSRINDEIDMCGRVAPVGGRVYC